MASIHSVLAAVFVGVVLAEAAPVSSNSSRTCATIESNISNASTVSYPGILNSVLQSETTQHWFQSSSQTPACVVEVGSPEDVSMALQAIGEDRTPFAVMSRGHASNPGFSSTEGVHISLHRMDKVVMSPDNTSVEIGFGQTWLDVFEKLDGTGYNVVGGRVPGPGIGGFTLGGGYSWKTNQHGLTCDTVKSYNLVLPNGTITAASSELNPDLFFALKGGMNRFGIVTSAVLETHQQPSDVHGGYILYPSTSVPALINLTSNFFHESTDRRTQIITRVGTSPLGNTGLALLFHDGLEKPLTFEAFENIPYLLNTVKTQSFAQMVKSVPAEVAQVTNIRGRFATMSTSEITPRFVNAVEEEVNAFGNIMALHSATSINYDIEPFNPYGTFATESAYPHDHSPLPLNLHFAWTLESEDDYWQTQMRDSLERLKEVAIQEGIYDDRFTQYPNYALASSTAEELYGLQNAARLREIREKFDPERIMDLAGGFVI